MHKLKLYPIRFTTSVAHLPLSQHTIRTTQLSRETKVFVTKFSYSREILYISKPQNSSRIVYSSTCISITRVLVLQLEIHRPPSSTSQKQAKMPHGTKLMDIEKGEFLAHSQYQMSLRQVSETAGISRGAISNFL